MQRTPSSPPGAPRRRNAIVYNPGLFDSTTPAMLAFIRLLKQRHASVLAALGGADEPRARTLRHNLRSLLFAEAFLEKGGLNPTQPRHPLQIAILGPTQAGKSSVVNWLLDWPLAGVSPLAGFTVHPQGFAVGVDLAKLDWLDGYFRDYERRDRGGLDARRYDCYALEAADIAEPPGPLRQAIFWDTPDFDSVDADEYRQAVLRVAALADVVILVLSKDKYADLAVWEFMGLLEPLGLPTLICLNKIEPAAYPALAESLRGKWRATRRDPPPPILPLPYLEASDDLAGLRKERAEFLADLDQARHAQTLGHHADRARKLIDTHWREWIAPVEAEHALEAEWRGMVEDAVADSLKRYQQDYLDHPHHYATFQRALAELLTLLEIPGLGGILVAARQAVTWPLRQLAKLGRKHPATPDGTEIAALNHALQHLFIRLGESLLLRRDEDATQQAWWREIGGLFRDDKPILVQHFEKATAHYLQGFQPEIDRTAHGLYDHLREHPALLNGLRATRVTTDATALAVALHTGGIGVQDFVIAPAMLSLTSLLTESALGKYMDKAAAELKRKQRAAVEKLFRDSLHARLIRLPGRLDRNHRFDIPPELLQAATQLDIRP